ncbi:hypothetical protein BCR43DRAFT_513756 [Syncephalastrum racemosum]|uniref:Uncharacterized protein n=1 Tax=Syncephalastrum racemosum TaxID=13706 RepID=A0A1X2HEE9_SYNRA|nr:hypothetical protein BCR43DRAFT_513756 [Syncephalastrum racemosum]
MSVRCDSFRAVTPSWSSRCPIVLARQGRRGWGVAEELAKSLNADPPPCHLEAGAVPQSLPAEVAQQAQHTLPSSRLGDSLHLSINGTKTPGPTFLDAEITQEVEQQSTRTSAAHPLILRTAACAEPLGNLREQQPKHGSALQDGRSSPWAWSPRDITGHEEQQGKLDEPPRDTTNDDRDEQRQRTPASTRQAWLLVHRHS